MKERRRHERSVLDDEVEVYDKSSNIRLGTLADLSSDGLRLAGAQRITQGTELDIRMLIPDGWSDIKELDFTAQCCWWDDDAAEEVHQTGFHIVDITDNEAFVIREILDLYGHPVPD